MQITEKEYHDLVIAALKSNPGSVYINPERTQLYAWADTVLLRIDDDFENKSDDEINRILQNHLNKHLAKMN